MFSKVSEDASGDKHSLEAGVGAASTGGGDTVGRRDADGRDRGLDEFGDGIRLGEK